MQYGSDMSNVFVDDTSVVTAWIRRARLAFANLYHLSLRLDTYLPTTR